MAARKLFYLIPVLLCLAVVFGFSSQSYEQQTIIPWLNRNVEVHWLSRWLPDLKFHYGDKLLWAKRMPYQFVEFVFRKGAHVVSYTVLGCSLYFSFRASRWMTERPLARLLGMTAGLGIVASLDEWNQTRVEMRTGQNIDVWLDIIGGTAGACVLLLGVVWYRSLRGPSGKGKGVICS